jgi:hypothetical protein
VGKVYRGKREAGGCTVTVDGEPLDPRLDIKTLSSSGFEWGYEGGGPGQLALAILADHFGDGGKALALFASFRGNVIANLGSEQWILTSDKIESALQGVVEVPMTLAELMDKVRGRG